MPLSRARFLLRLGLGLLFGALAFAAFQLLSAPPATDPPGPRSGGADLQVFIAFVIGGTGLFVAYIGWRTMRLVSPANTIAKWTVSPDEWQRYVAACQMRVTMPGALVGAVPLDTVVPAGGIEVHALKRGFRVGDAFHELGGLGAEILDMRVVDSPVDMFEFNVTYPVGRYSSVSRGVRVPIASNAKPLANTVEDYWVKRQPLQTLSVEELRARARSGWTLAIVGLLAFLGVIALYIIINPPGWAVIGPIGTMGLALYGFARGVRARHLLLRRGG